MWQIEIYEDDYREYSLLIYPWEEEDHYYSLKYVTRKYLSRSQYPDEFLRRNSADYVIQRPDFKYLPDRLLLYHAVGPGGVESWSAGPLSRPIWFKKIKVVREYTVYKSI